MSESHVLDAASDHDKVCQLLPWYVNGTLSLAEQGVVDRHLEMCQTCREELEHCRQLDTALAANSNAEWRPSERHFAEILKNVDALENDRVTAPVKRKRQHLLAAIGDWLFGTPTPVRWILATETAALGALVLVMALSNAAPQPLVGQNFETLSSEEQLTALSSPQAHVVFAEDIIEREMRALLRSIDAELTAGPTALGVYTIGFADSERATRIVEQAIVVLQAHPKVQFAEPVIKGGQ